MTLKRFDRTVFGLLCAFLAVLFVYLFGYSMLYTSRIDTGFIAAEVVLYQKDSLVINLVRVINGLFVCFLTVRLGEKLPLKTFTALCLTLTFVMGCAWVLVHRGVPINDTGILHYTAAELARGNPSELWRHEVYLRTNPHQAGYLLYSEIMQRLFGRRTTIPQGILNAVWLTGAYAAVLSLTWRSFRDRSIQRLTVLMLMLFIQPVFYTSFLYGNLPGMCAALWAVDFILYGFKKRIGMVIACILLCIAVVLKPNFLILALALAIVLAVRALSLKRFASLFLAVCVLVLPVFSAKSVQLLLEKRTGFDMGAGAPQTLWLAMGMQESTRAPGWYNHYPTDTMQAAGCDVDKVAQIVRGDIAARAEAFAADPSYAMDFYHQKMVSQWSNTAFEIDFTNAVMENKSPWPGLVDRLLTGDLFQLLAGYMEGYTLVLYLGFAAGCALLAVSLFKGKADWQQLFGPFTLLLTILGGFLYHMLFEAKSQYVLFYLPMMIPTAAAGLKRIMAKRS